MEIIIKGDRKFVERLIKENRIRFSRMELSWNEVENTPEVIPEPLSESTTEGDPKVGPEQPLKIEPKLNDVGEQGEKKDGDAATVTEEAKVGSSDDKKEGDNSDLDSDPDF
ncbi:MAG: hypothetical protein RSH25_13030 [Bacteroides sp.]|uniref:hypothetical protein n=1 Tax=Bacteroides sp. TaxID=29523 RepID=UPI002FC75813